MAFMAQPTQSKSGLFYLRRRIPKDLRPHFPDYGEFYRVSLKTNDAREARIRYAAENARLEELFRNARLQQSGDHSPTLQDALQLASRWGSTELERMDSSGDFTPYLVDTGDEEYETLSEAYDHYSPKALLESDRLSLHHREALEASISKELTKVSLPMPQPGTPFHGFLREAFLIKHLELSLLAYKRSQGNFSALLPLRPSAPLTIERTKREAPSETLSAVFEQWSRHYLNMGDDKRDVKKTAGEYQTTIERFIELLGDLPVKQIKRKTIEDFYGLLRQMPTKGEGIRKLNAHEQIARAKQMDLPLLSSLTIKNKLMGLSSVLAYALKMEYIAENPVTESGITKSLSKAGAKQSRIAARKGYTEAELIQVFSSPVFKGQWAPARASFGAAWIWIPLLLCYTGARREEIAQMTANEVRRSEDGIWYLDLLGTTDEGSDEARTLKTNGSHRMVALHQDLIDLGFIDYAQSMPAKGQLFPALKTNPDGYYGHNFGKQWGGYLRKVAELDSPVSPSHGFRHAFKTMCRTAGIPEEIHDAITGHDDGSVSRRYGERHLLRTQYEQLSRLPSIARRSGLLP
jgi:integrase